MSQEKQVEVTDKVLLDAWAELAVYDGTASELKQKFIERRYQVISLTLIATIASVVITWQIDFQIFTYFLAALAVTLPLIAAALMDDTMQFTGTNSWIKYRYIAEMMRMHVYLYRMGAGVYYGLSDAEIDNVFSDNISAMKSKIDMNKVVPATVKKPRKQDEILDAIRDANVFAQDGQAWEKSLEPEQYLDVRLRSSRDWYERKIHTDFENTKQNTRLARFSLLIGSLGTVIVGLFAGFLAGDEVVTFQVVSLVAITNSISAYFVTRSNISMIGKTYSLFQIAVTQLSDMERRWYSMANDEVMQNAESRPQAIAEFVSEVEQVLLWEREEWYEMALQTQEAVDQVIIGDLDRLKKRADAAQINKALPGDPVSNPQSLTTQNTGNQNTDSEVTASN